MVSIRSALTHTFATNYLQLILQVVGLVVLARLLGPEEIGVYTIAAVFVAFAKDLRSFAVGHYIVQESELTEQRIRAAFTVTLGLGFTLGLIVFVIAPYAGDFYEEAGVTAVLSLLAVNFLLAPFGIVAMSMFRRNLQFGKIMVIETASNVAHTTTAIVLAFIGLSYMSLAWAAIAGTVTSLVLVQIMRPAGLPWMPGFKEIRRVFSFGIYMTGSTMIARLGADLPKMIVGKTLGLPAVGLISRGGSLIGIFNNLVLRGLRPVIMPYFSAKRRSGDDLGASYLYAVTCVTGLAWPFYISLGLLADPVVNVLLGDKWTEVVPLLTFWVLAPCIWVLTPFEQDLFAAAGQVKRYFPLQTAMSLSRIVIVASAAFHSLQLLVIAFSVSQVVQRTIIVPAIYRLIKIDLRAHRRAISPSLIVAAVTGLAVYATRLLPFVSQGHALLQLGTGGVAALLGWTLGCQFTGHPLWAELSRAIIGMRRRLSSS